MPRRKPHNFQPTKARSGALDKRKPSRYAKTGGAIIGKSGKMPLRQTKRRRSFTG